LGHSAPHLSFLLVRLGGFDADYFRGNPSTLRAARLSGARCSGFGEADARLITNIIGKMEACEAIEERRQLRALMRHRMLIQDIE
jgi:hypothetical protein